MERVILNCKTMQSWEFEIKKNLIDRTEAISKSMKNELCKKEFTEEKREKLSKEHEAMPGGSFPIENTSDLHNAVKAIGRAKDYEKAKKWIIKRAHELNAVEELPEDWKVKKALDLIFDAICKGECDELLEKGKKAMVGEKRKWGNNEYEKTVNGWKLTSHKGEKVEDSDKKEEKPKEEKPKTNKELAQFHREQMEIANKKGEGHMYHYHMGKRDIYKELHEKEKADKK